MPTGNHIICFLLAVLIHVLGLLLFGLLPDWRPVEEEVSPELDVASVELTLSDDDSAVPSAPGAAAARQTEQAPPTIDVPKPVDPVPQPLLPEKPSFEEVLPLPEPELEPLPQPAPVPLPPPAPQPPPPQPRPVSSAPAVAAEKPVAKPVAAPSVGGASDAAASLQPSGGSYGRVDAHPALKRAIKPNYPIGARRRGEEGTVVLDVVVTVSGRSGTVKLVASCGFPELDAAAERAAAQAQFKPGTRNGRAVESAARLTIIFRLRDQ